MTDDKTYDVPTGGPQRAPRSRSFRIARVVVGLAVLIGLLWAAAVGAGSLPRQTQLSSLIVRAMIGLSIGVILTLFVRRMSRAFGEAPVGPPTTVDARGSDVVYECPVCGTRVRLEVAATAKAPRHCGEEMEASLG